MSTLVIGQLSVTNQFTVSTNGTLGTIDPTGFSNLIFTGTALQTVNGCIGSNGKLLFVQNQGTNNVIFKNNDSSASAGAKIITGIGSDMTIGPNQTVMLIYDNSTSLWKAFSLPPVTIQQTDFNQTDNTAQNYLVNKPTLLSQFTNDPSFISGITSTMIGTALGFTPVSPSSLSAVASSIPTNNNQLTNGSNFITGLTFAQVTSKPTTLTGFGITDGYSNSNPAGYISSVPPQTFSSITSKPTTIGGYGITDAYPLSGNPSGFLTSIAAQSWASITGKPNFATVATSALYSDLTGTPTIPSNTSQISESGNLYYTQARFDSAFTGKNTSNLSEGTNLYYTTARFNTALATKTTADLPEGTSLYYTQTRFNTAFSAKSTSDLTEGSNLYYTDARVRAAHTITPGVTRAINSSTYTISSTKNSRVYYTIRISCTSTIGSASAGAILLQYSTNGGTSYIDAASVENSNTITLAVTLNSVTVQTAVICAEIPSNALCRMVPTTSGTTTITYVRGMEVTY